MKKAIAILLTIISVFCMSACDQPKNSQSNYENATQAPENTEPTQAIPQNIERLGNFRKTVQLEETILYNENDIIITAKSIEYNSYSADIEIFIENNSSEELDFSSGYEHIIVNGYMISDGYMSCDIPSGKSAKEEISLSYNSMIIYGIYEFADISIGFTITDDEYDKTYIAPVAVKLSNANSDSQNNLTYQEAITHPYTLQELGYSLIHFSNDTIFEQQNIRIVSQCILKNIDDEMILLLEAISESQSLFRLRLNSISINDLVVYGGGNWTTDLVIPESTNIIGINLSNIVSENYWEIYGLRDIASVSIDIEIMDYEYDVVEESVAAIFTIPGATASFDKTGLMLHTDNNCDIVFKTIMDGDNSYDNGIYILLLAENKSGRAIVLDDEYDSFSINGLMSDCSFSSTSLEPGQCGLLEIHIYEYMLEDSGITKAADIENFEITFELEDDNYREIDSFTIQHSQQLT